MKNAYSVSIQLEPGVMTYDKSYMNGESNKVSDNTAIKESIALLETLSDETLIGILITRMECHQSPLTKRWIGSGDVHNTYSHIYNDMSNWVTVKEAKDFLKAM